MKAMIIKPSNIKKRWVLVAVFVFIELAFGEQAFGQSLILGGTQFDADASYSYFGLIQPLGSAKLGEGWFASAMGHELKYNYNTGSPSVRVDTVAPGVDLGLGYAWSGNQYSASLSASIGYDDFIVHPKKIAGQSKPSPQGEIWLFTPQIQVKYDITPKFSLYGIINYGFGSQEYWSRYRALWETSANMGFGPEIILQGGPNYTIRNYGAFVSLWQESSWNLNLSSGVSSQLGNSSSGYLSLSFSKLF